MTKIDISRNARNRGIRLTIDKGGKRVRKSGSVLLKEIRDHDNEIIRARGQETKNMLMMCKSIFSNSNMTRKISPKPLKGIIPPPPPPPPPPALMMKGKNSKPIIPPPPPPVKKMSLMNELKGKLNKKGLKQKSNKNAKITVA